MTQPTTSVVVVNFRAEDLVSGLADQYLDAGFEVVVVDNSDTYEGPGRVVRGHGNVGFGGGCNRGVAVSSGRRVVVHNADVDADVDAVRRLTAAIGSTLELVAPSIDTGRVVRRAGFAYPTPLREVYLSRKHIAVAGRGADGNSAPTPITPAPRRRSLGRRFGSAAVLAFARSAFDRIGGFDERFFLYVEDLELWHRARRSGVRTGFQPSVVFCHREKSGSSALNLEWREVNRWLGVELFAALHARSWRPYRTAHWLAMGGRSMTTSLGCDVLARWRRREDPFEVAAAVQAGITSGELHDEI